MTTQPEQFLEDNLVKQLNTLGYSLVSFINEEYLLKNLIAQLKKQWTAVWFIKMIVAGNVCKKM